MYSKNNCWAYQITCYHTILQTLHLTCVVISHSCCMTMLYVQIIDEKKGELELENLTY